MMDESGLSITNLVWCWIFTVAGHPAVVGHPDL